MTSVYAAFYGEYEEAYPIGIYSTLHEAKLAVINSNPTYSTEIKEYNINTGQEISEYNYNVLNKTWYTK